MGASEKLDSSSRVILDTLMRELKEWNHSEIKLDVHVRKIECTKGTATISIILCLKEGEEGFEVHVDYRGGFCRDDYRGFSSINAERALKSAIARAAVIEELNKF
jgi:hypothetical protein